jgi:hypothetical protein
MRFRLTVYDQVEPHRTMVELQCWF